MKGFFKIFLHSLLPSLVDEAMNELFEAKKHTKLYKLLVSQEFLNSLKKLISMIEHRKKIDL